MPFFYTKLVEALDNLDTAHEGLYLGFRPSKPPADDRLTALWSDFIPVIEYQVSEGLGLDAYSPTARALMSWAMQCMGPKMTSCIAWGLR